VQFEDPLDDSQGRCIIPLGNVRLAVLVGSAPRPVAVVVLLPPTLKFAAAATAGSAAAGTSSSPPSPGLLLPVTHRAIVARPAVVIGRSDRSFRFAGLVRAVLLIVGSIIRIVKTAFILEDNVVGGAVS